MRKKQVVVSWSGGKDCCFACYKAMNDGLEVSYILNCASQEYRRASAHGVRIELIALQAQALGVPLYQNLVTKDDYEQKFKSAVVELKKKGISDIVTGDIHLEDARDWIDMICKETGVSPIRPLWGKDPKSTLLDFINAGFETIVVCTKADLLGEEWLGRKIDHDFIEELSKAKPNIDLCGEKGEFHTFVVNGPIFEKRVNVSYGKKVLRNGHWFLDLEEKILKD